MAEHTLKTLEPYFDAVVSGDKTFDVRPNDRGYQKGDVLHLVRVDKPYNGTFHACNAGRCTKRRVTYVFGGDPHLPHDGGVKPGFVVLGFSSTDALGPIESTT